MPLEISTTYQLTKNRSEFLPVNIVEDGLDAWCVCVSIDGMRAGEVIAEGFTTPLEAETWCSQENLPVSID